VTENKQPEGLAPEELAEQSGEELPDREQMSLVNANVAIPVNAAVAATVLSDGAVAYADAAQTTPIDQSN
jgi:2-polyprenyl-6-methoxyphenol hydroxylase-like FAD-dependent oxidoreductase